MASVGDIVAEMRANPGGVSFPDAPDACKVADHFFGEPRQNGTSHRVWKMPWLGDPRVHRSVIERVEATGMTRSGAGGPKTALRPLRLRVEHRVGRKKKGAPLWYALIIPR